jgi:hypothetical protein
VLPKVSVKSRIATFENRSPIVQTFGSSPPRPGKVTSVNHSFPLSPEKRGKNPGLADLTSNLDLSETEFPPLPVSVHIKSRRGFAPTTAESEAATVVPSPPAVLQKEYTPFRASPQSPLRVTVQSLQASTPSSDTEHQFLTPPPIDGSKPPEQPKTPRFGKASVIPIRSKGAGSERPFPEPSRPQPRLQIPSFSCRFPPGDPLQRVKQNDVPGPRPKPEDALARQNRYKPPSSLSQVSRAESSEERSPELAPTESSLSVDEGSSQLSPVPEGQLDVGRSLPTHRNRATTLRSSQGIEFAEEQIIFSRTTESLLEGDSGRSTVLHSRTVLVPKPLRLCCPTVARPEAKDSGEQILSPAGSGYAYHKRRGADADHPNFSTFSFSFDTTTSKDPDTFREAQHKLKRNSKSILLPSPLSRLGYNNPPGTPELPDSEARTFEFSVPTLEGALVSDSKRPSRRRAATSLSHTRHPLSFGPYTEPFSLGPPGQLHSFRPILFEDGSILPLESEIKLLRHQREQVQKARARSNFWRASLKQYLSTYSPPDSSLESTEDPAQGAPKAGAQHLEISVPQEPEELTPRITRSLIQHRLRPSDSESESDSDAMDRLRPESALAVSQHRREAIRLAKAQETSVLEKCRRSGASIPEYAFDELIGKGSFGRVYKW